MLFISYCRQLSLSSYLSVCHNFSTSSATQTDAEPPMGRVFDSKPVHMELEAGKTYGWCTCGHSNKQVTRLLASMQKLMCIGIVTLLVVFSGHCFKKI